MQNLLFYISSRARGTILNRSWQGVCVTLRQKDEWTMPLLTDIVHNELTLLYVGKLISRPRQGREILTQADHSSCNFYHENPTIWYTRAYSSLARKYRSHIFLEYLFLNFIIDCLKFFCCRIIRWYVERLWYYKEYLDPQFYYLLYWYHDMFHAHAARVARPVFRLKTV